MPALTERADLIGGSSSLNAQSTASQQPQTITAHQHTTTQHNTAFAAAAAGFTHPHHAPNSCCCCSPSASLTTAARACFDSHSLGRATAARITLLRPSSIRIRTLQQSSRATGEGCCNCAPHWRLLADLQGAVPGMVASSCHSIHRRRLFLLLFILLLLVVV